MRSATIASLGVLFCFYFPDTLKQLHAQLHTEIIWSTLELCCPLLITYFDVVFLVFLFGCSFVVVI